MPSNSKLATFWLLTMLTVVGVLGGQLLTRQQAPIETNILALLPENRQDPAAEAAFSRVAASMSDKVLFVIGSQNKPELFSAAEQFSQELSSIGMFSSITAKVSQSQQQAWGELYFPKRAHLLTPEQKARLQNEPQQQVQAVLQALYNPFSGVTGQELQADPFLLFRDYLSQLGHHAGNVTLKNGFLTTNYQGKEYVLLSADLEGSAYSLALQEKIPALAELETSIRESYGVEVLHTGVIFYAAHGTASAKGEISTIGLGSLLGVITLLLVVFRSPLPLALALLSIGCGLLTAFVTTVAVFGKVHLFSLVFGASLIGVSIDYAFHFLTERLAAGQSWDARQGLKHIFAAISLGLTMSLIGYLCMMIAPFPGLQQLSLFSAAGLAAAYATVVCWYPVLAARPGKSVAIPMTGIMAAWLRGWMKPSVRLGVPALCLAVAAVGLYRASYNDDIRQLQALPVDLKQQEETIKAITGVSGSQQMLLVKAANEQALLVQLERVGDKLAKFTQQGILEGYQSIHQYVPSEQTQAQNYQLIEQLYRQQGPALAQQLKLHGDIVIEQQFSPLTVDDFVRSPASAPLRFLWLGELEGQQSAVILLKGVSKAEIIQTFAAENHAVSYLDKAEEVSSIFAEYRQRITELLFAAAGVILTILSWRYGLGKAFRVIAPPAIACCVGIAVTGFLGTPLNLFNLLGLFLILGIGIDYTLFFAEQSKADSTLLAISLSAVTTILSFGLLALSETQAIHSFGITVLTGILTAWLLAPLSLSGKVADSIRFTDEIRS
ncbi:MMPL family transporter [Photobacterium sp. SDRW27]|uniref:MMPL family transporter n=1 Tax=Photobacterium obscurum TaxID=2829490 RepID=UPI00224326B2|nr:MMPL family transporter [Photobacterium obscurum]MCW8328971.1 MMPL family transporter [Photobacterium obscurum]